tara:strand:+ start:5586 stop:5774 length:189 start_codon:yes stop_codon:yes gene_type:complete
MSTKEYLNYTICFIILFANIAYWRWWCLNELIMVKVEAVGTFWSGFILTVISIIFIYDKTKD